MWSLKHSTCDTTAQLLQCDKFAAISYPWIEMQQNKKITMLWYDLTILQDTDHYFNTTLHIKKVFIFDPWLNISQLHHQPASPQKSINKTPAPNQLNQ